MDKIVVGSFLYNFFYMAAMGFVSSVLPVYATELGADVTTIGPIWTLSYLSSFVMALFWASISDGSGKRMPHIAMGTAIMSLICVLYTFVENVYSLGAVMILGQMLGSAQAFPIFMTLVNELTSIDRRGRSMGVFWMGGSVGWALSVLVAGSIAEQYGMRKGFYLSSALYLLALIAVKGSLGTQAIRVPAERRVSFGEAIRDFSQLGSAFVVFWLATICFYVADVVKISYVLIFFERELGLSRPLATMVLSLGTWVEIPTLPLLGTLSDKIGRKPLLLLGLFTAGLSNVLMAVSQTYIHAVLTMLLFGVVWGAFTSAASAFVGEAVDARSTAKAMSLYSSAFSIAGIAAPMAMSLAIVKTSFRTAFIMVAMIVAAGFLLILLGIRTAKPSGEKNQEAEE